MFDGRFLALQKEITERSEDIKAMDKKQKELYHEIYLLKKEIALKKKEVRRSAPSRHRRRHVPSRGYGRAGTQNYRLGEAVILGTGVPTPAQ